MDKKVLMETAIQDADDADKNAKQAAQYQLLRTLQHHLGNAATPATARVDTQLAQSQYPSSIQPLAPMEPYTKHKQTVIVMTKTKMDMPGKQHEVRRRTATSWL